MQISDDSPVKYLFSENFNSGSLPNLPEIWQTGTLPNFPISPIFCDKYCLSHLVNIIPSKIAPILLQLLSERKSRYLLGNSMTEYDCELMPRLHHIRIIGLSLLGFDIPHNFTHLWAYILTAYRTAAFIESCPADQDIIHHYKVRMKLQTTDLLAGIRGAEEQCFLLKKPTKKKFELAMKHTIFILILSIF